MRSIARLAVVLAAALALGACNLVVTDEPMFNDADSASSVVMKPGVWVFDTPCPAEKQAQNECEAPTPFLITASDIRKTDQTDPSLSEPPMPYVLVAGDPPIAQIEAQSPEAGARADTFYIYAAVHPTKFDDDKKVVVAEVWPIMCGPPPAPGQGGGKDGDATTQPLEGMKMGDGAQCTPFNKGVLANAVQPSKDWAGGAATIWWKQDKP